MDNTTLHTFLFHCPAASRNLVLLGSWDNFTRPYHLELDTRRGRNYWRGCFTFQDIICDGDLNDQAPKRDGLLKMGGTYWYYYKIDGDDECHNPSEPSTTFCPLLPGQRLNVLELPSEGHARSHSEPSDGFTRNPSDRYLNPVPPTPQKPSSSPHLGSANTGSYRLPPPSPWAPRSATYPPPDTFLSPNVVRHARSASASPHMPSNALFSEFKCLKDKLTSKRSASRTRSSSKSQELEIGSPVLVSTTSDDFNLIPLPSYRPAPTSAPHETLFSAITATHSRPAIKKEFSPLGSHPVTSNRDTVSNRAELSCERRTSPKRRRSHVPPTIVTSEFKMGHSRTRANSSDTRRTQNHLFENDPWLSTPKHQQRFEAEAQYSTKEVVAAPMLQRPSGSLAPPCVNERPSSSHGSNLSPSLRSLPLNKELPELPRYLKPAPLFACNPPSPVELPAEELNYATQLHEKDDDGALGDLITDYEDKPRSHFSTWSNESMAYTTSDDDEADSPTFSSLTSDCSDAGSPQQPSLRYSYAELDFDSRHASTNVDEPTTTTFLSTTPPRLDDLRISAFGTDLFNLDIQHSDAAPRRQAACFGLGFQYSLPDDDVASKTTLTNATLRPEPSVQRESSASMLNQLMDDFAYLGDAVV